jgi:hypothetical protein
MDQLLLVPKEEALSTFELLKADAAKAGIGNMGNEIMKQRLSRCVGLPAAPFAKTPMKVLHLLKRRAWNEKASEMREHPEAICCALLGCFLHVRTMFWTTSSARQSTLCIELMFAVTTSSIGS